MSESKSKRHEQNPFIEGMVVPVKGRNIQVSPLGRDSNVLINTETGEHFGTHVTTVKKVDAEQFVKLFTQNIGLTFGLKTAGIKVLSVLMWVVQHKALGKDLLPLDKYTLRDFLQENDPNLKLSLPTFGRGLAELEGAKIIAKHMRQGWYFINPNFIFNGDRIAFTTIIERKKKAQDMRDREHLESIGQQRLIDD